MVISKLIRECLLSLLNAFCCDKYCVFLLLGYVLDVCASHSFNGARRV